MIRSLVQFEQVGQRGVAALDAAGRAWRVRDCATTRELALQAMAQGVSLAELAARNIGPAIDLYNVTLLPPIDHADPAHVLVSGTGLTHLGSAEGRDKMHRAASAGENLTDSMRMFLMGAVGYYFIKKEIVPDAVLAALNDLLMYLFLPCLESQ